MKGNTFQTISFFFFSNDFWRMCNWISAPRSQAQSPSPWTQFRTASDFSTSVGCIIFLYWSTINPLWLYSGNDKWNQGIRSDRQWLKNYGQRFVTLYRRQWSRPSQRKRKAKKAKWLSEQALQIAEKIREVKVKDKRKDIPIWM